MAYGMFGPDTADLEAQIEKENWAKRYQGDSLEASVGNLFQSGFGLAAKAMGAEDPRMSRAKKMKEAAAEAQANAKPGDTKDLYLQLSKSFEKYGFPEEALKAATAYRTMTREDNTDERENTKLDLAKNADQRAGEQLGLAKNADQRQDRELVFKERLWDMDLKTKDQLYNKTKTELDEVNKRLAAMPKNYYGTQFEYELKTQQADLAAKADSLLTHAAQRKMYEAQAAASNASTARVRAETQDQFMPPVAVKDSLGEAVTHLVFMPKKFPPGTIPEPKVYDVAKGHWVTKEKAAAVAPPPNPMTAAARAEVAKRQKEKDKPEGSW